jgi:hypothetical protein
MALSNSMREKYLFKKMGRVTCGSYSVFLRRLFLYTSWPTLVDKAWHHIKRSFRFSHACKARGKNSGRFHAAPTMVFI